MAYFDTAYLLKYYLKEQGFGEIFTSDRRLLAAAPSVGIAGVDVVRAPESH